MDSGKIVGGPNMLDFTITKYDICNCGSVVITSTYLHLADFPCISIISVLQLKAGEIRFI